MVLGYDWPRLHAVFNHLPAALLPVSVLFDLLGVWLKRESLKAAAFWTLVAGVAGTGLAIIAGELASDVAQHSEQAHDIMESHETLAFVVLAIFGVLAIWRIVRRGVWREREQPIALTAGVIGIAILAYGAHLGGKLMFDHAVGISTVRPVYGPLPGSVTVILDAAPDAVIATAQREVRAAGLTVVAVAADEGYLETGWYDVETRRNVGARAPDLDHTVKLRLFADPTAGKTRLVAECVRRIAYDPSEPERDLERMVSDSTPQHAPLDSLLARLKVAYPPPRPPGDTSATGQP